MKKKCKRCNWIICELDLSKEQKLKIRRLLNEDLKLNAIEYLNLNLNLSLEEAKGIVMHLNKTFGFCLRCNFNKLTNENIECPKCKAFSYNLNI